MIIAFVCEWYSFLHTICIYFLSFWFFLYLFRVDSYMFMLCMRCIIKSVERRKVWFFIIIFVNRRTDHHQHHHHRYIHIHIWTYSFFLYRLCVININIIWWGYMYCFLLEYIPPICCVSRLHYSGNNNKNITKRHTHICIYTRRSRQIHYYNIYIHFYIIVLRIDIGNASNFDIGPVAFR